MPESWLTPIDNYCERLGPGFWAEPLNAATNAAFIAAALYALVLWRRAGSRDGPALWLVAVTFVVGTGSFLFHTFANRWSLLADVLPIAVFIYSYFLLAMRRYLNLGLVAAIGATALFMVFNMSFGRLWFGVLPGMTLNGSVGYIPAALALLAVVFRSIDGTICATIPAGSHFLWHGLNAFVLLILTRAAIVHPPRKGMTLAQN
jgi:hypothetical protein